MRATRDLCWIAAIIALFPGPNRNVRAESGVSSHALSATVRMVVRDNRVFIPLQISGPSGKSKVVFFWVDSGGDAIVLSGPLAAELGLSRARPSFQGMSETPAHFVTKPQLSIAGMDVDLTHVSVAASESKFKNAFAGVDAEGFLPATVLKQYDVVLDYPTHRFTLAHAGAIAHRGASVPMSVKPSTGFARIEIMISGHQYGFMLDTGAAYTGVSNTLMSHWIAEHASWPHSTGAVGAANMVGKQFDVTNKMLRIPEMTWGRIQLKNVGMVSRPAGVYERFVSEDMTAPIVGALSGNVLRRFRLELDYPAGVAYLQPETTVNAADAACVGLIVQVKQDGVIVISGIPKHDGKMELDGIEPGDVLLRVDDHSVTGASLATVLDLLSGRPGERKRITIRRGERDVSVFATVSAYP